MDPTHNEHPSLSLPAPSFEALPSGVGEHHQMLGTPEAHQLSPSPPSLLPLPKDPPVNNGIPLDPLPLVPVDPTSQTTPVNSVLTAADDSDLIEKEWVDKAKAIVASTKDDPYRQTKEVNHFRADYMKRRYNRDLKIAED